MTTKSKILGAIVLLVVLFLGVRYASQPKATGGVVYDVSNLVGDVYQGLNHTLMMQSGVFVGPINTDDAATFTSTVAATGKVTLNGGQLRSYTNSTSTTATTYTAVQADILNYDTILMTPNTAAITITLPATSTLTSMVPAAGDRQETCIYNATSTTAATITLAAGAGMDLERTATSTVTGSTGVLAIAGRNSACLTFIREPDTDISVLMQNFIDAD